MHPQALPLPVAALARRAANAKSPTERHLLACNAWEASVRLAVAATPPGELASFKRPSLGTWVGAYSFTDGLQGDDALLATYRLLAAEGIGENANPKAVTAGRLLSALPAYRNRVVGHGSTRDDAYYARAGQVLADGLHAAWERALFWPAGARLQFVESVRVDPGGGLRARVIDLSGVASWVTAEDEEVGAAIVPARLYLRTDAGLRQLHPWVVFEAQAGAAPERVLFYDHLQNGPAYLDFATGDWLRGKAVATRFPGLDAEWIGRLEGTAPREAPAAPAIDATLFGDFRMLAKVGEGGMGAVYLARQESLGRLVALKVLPTGSQDDTAVARFRREITALARCEHPNVVRILASGVTRGTSWYAMELVDGADLSEVGRALASTDDVFTAVSTASERVRAAKEQVFASVPDLHRPEPPELPPEGAERHRAIARLFRDGAAGLDHLHRAGIVHRDVKPGNLMVTARELRLVVMDLGLAAMSDASRSITRDRSSLLGTLRYMPPEQLQRNILDVDARADVYALGATFYEVFTGRPFLDGDTEVRLVQQILHEEPVDPTVARPDLPRPLRDILMRCTRKLPQERYGSAADLARDLDAFLDGKPTVARPGSGRRRPPRVAVAAVVALVAAAAALWAVRSWGPRPHPEPPVASGGSASVPGAPPVAAPPVAAEPPRERTANAAAAPAQPPPVGGAPAHDGATKPAPRRASARSDSSASSPGDHGTPASPAKEPARPGAGGSEGFVDRTLQLVTEPNGNGR
jgi:serine/threonine protein kinase